MRAYISAFRIRVKLELQYRAAALGGLVTQVFFGLIAIYLYRALYGANADPALLSATATYVWIQQAFFRMVLGGDAALTDAILKGDFVYQIVRPVDQYSYWFSRILAQKSTGSLMRALPMLLFAALLPNGLGLSAPAGAGALLCAIFALLLGLITVTAVESISAGFVLLTLDNRGIYAIFSFIELLLCGNTIPLTLFPDSWQRFNQWQPFAQILDAPIRLYTGEYALSRFAQVALVQLGWIVVLVLLWRCTLRRVIVQGG